MKDDQLLNLTYWRSLLSRQRWLITACALGVAVLAGILSEFMAPIYQATCILYLNPQRVQALSFQDLYTKQLARPNDLLLTQIEILQSPPIVRRAVKDLEQRDVLRFDKPAADPPGTWIGRALSSLHPTWGGPEDTGESRRSAFVTSLVDATDVTPGGGNMFVSVSVKHSDPRLAAQLANAIVDAYLRNDREMLRKSADEATSWLSEKVRKQKDELLAAEKKLRETIGKDAPKADEVGDLAVQEVSRLQQALLDLRLRILETEAQGAGGGLGGPKTTADDLQLQVNQALRERVRKELVDTSLALTQLRQRYGERHPDVIQMAEKERELRTQLEALGPDPATSPLASGTKGAPAPVDLGTLRAQEKALQDSLEKTLQSTYAKGQAGSHYAILKREVEIEQSLYNEILSRLNELVISAGLDSATAEVFESARPPRDPISPNAPRTILLGLLGGLLLGLASAAVRDHFDDSVRDPAQANDLLKAPVLGVIPYGRRKAPPASGRVQELFVKQEEESAIAESYRILRSHIQGSLALSDSTVLLVTSAVPGEGKTSTAANLAAAFAETGGRVLLVDGDLRRRTLSRYFSHDLDVGASQMLRGERGPEQVIRPTGINNLDLLGCSALGTVHDGGQLTKPYHALFEWARTRYERVVVDMPIVTVVPGVAEVARANASVLLVHRPGWVPAQVLEQVRHHLGLSNCQLAGVVLNAVRARWISGSYPLLPYYRTVERGAVHNGHGTGL